MFQPRLGVAWDVNGDGKSKCCVSSAGQYYARVAALNFASVRNNNGSIGQTMFRNSALTGILGAPPASTSCCRRRERATYRGSPASSWSTRTSGIRAR